MPVSLYTRFTAHLDAVLDALEAEGTLPAGLNRKPVTVEPPRDPSHGDLATNAAMVLAKPAGTNPRALADAINRRGNEFVIDYEHQTVLSADNGQPAPAAGWAARVEWRDGLGLFAADIRWTDRARAMLAAGEYRYISPVLVSDASGTVVDVLHAALVAAVLLLLLAKAPASASAPMGTGTTDFGSIP